MPAKLDYLKEIFQYFHPFPEYVQFIGHILPWVFSNSKTGAPHLHSWWMSRAEEWHKLTYSPCRILSQSCLKFISALKVFKVTVLNENPLMSIPTYVINIFPHIWYNKSLSLYLILDTVFMFWKLFPYYAIIVNDSDSLIS